MEIGYHVGRLLEDYDSVQRNFRFRPDEIFTRIKISLLVALISESALLEHHLKEAEEPAAENIAEAGPPEQPKMKYNSFFPFAETEE
jgi:hypothetical protein